MIQIRFEADKPTLVELDVNSANQLIDEAVCIVGVLVHELSDVVGDQAVEYFLELVRRMDKAGAFFLEERGGRLYVERDCTVRCVGDPAGRVGCDNDGCIVK